MWRPRRGKNDTVSNFVKLWRPSWTVSFFIYSWPIVKSKIQSTNLHWPCRRWTRLWHTWFSWRSYGRTSGWSSWRLGWWFCTLISAILQAKNLLPLIKGFDVKAPILYHFGHSQPNGNVKLYLTLVNRLQHIFNTKCLYNTKAHSSGKITLSSQ